LKDRQNNHFMNRTLLLLSIFACSFAQAQQPFRDLSLKKAFKKAAAQNKLVFIQIISDDCVQCNDVANKAFEDPKLKERLSNDWVTIRIGASTPDGIEAAAIFDRDKGFGSLITDKDKNPVYQFNKTTSFAPAYVEVLDSATASLQKIVRLKEMEAAYFSAGQKDWRLLEKLIQRKAELGQNTGLLLTEYLNLVPEDSVNTDHVIRFITQQSPVTGSKARRIIYKDRTLFNQVWNSLPLDERVLINQRTISKSMTLAVTQKDESYARTVARFAANTYAPEKQDAIYEQQLLNYYYRTADTARYLALGLTCYNREFEALTNEKINQVQKERLEQAFAKALADTLNRPAGAQRMVRSAPVASYPSAVASRMNQAAYTFYKMDRQGLYLANTLEWIKRAVEIFPTPNNQDTYARILYRSGEKDLAISYEEKAIEDSKKQGSERKEWQSLIEKMKRNEPVD